MTQALKTNKNPAQYGWVIYYAYQHVVFVVRLDITLNVKNSDSTAVGFLALALGACNSRAVQQQLCQKKYK
jgi:hypothetical protein